MLFYENGQTKNGISDHEGSWNCCWNHHPLVFFVLTLTLVHINQTFLIFSIHNLFLLFTTPHLIFLHSGIVHQSNIVVDIKAEKRTWRKKTDWLERQETELHFTPYVVQNQPHLVTQNIIQSRYCVSEVESFFAHLPDLPLALVTMKS